MSGSGLELRLWEDTLSGGQALRFPADGLNRVVYVLHGSVHVGGRDLADDEAWHGRGAADLVAGRSGVTLWRWELAPAGSAPVLLDAPAGRTLPKLSAALTQGLAQPALMRADSVAFPPGGCAFLHTHQGPGIRCLVEGGIRIDTEGRSTSYGPGGAWFESGPEPVFAQAAPDRPSRFVRVMLLPAALKGASSIAYVNPEDREKPKSQRYKGYVDEPIVV